MGWIKAELDELTHEAVRIEVEQSDKSTHEVAAELINERLKASDSMMEAEERLGDSE
jgi:hypothetical protein